MANKKWYDALGADSDIAISSRIRLARNVEALPFPRRMEQAEAEKLLQDMAALLCSGDFRLIDLKAPDKNAAGALMERHLISPELAKGGPGRGVLVSGDDSVSVMVGEEDHLRIQAMGVGLCLEACMEKATEVDNLVESRFKLAFDERLGYLTSCPTNLGTGLRASVMLHLPALTESGEMQRLIAAAGKLGLAIRGLYGEGTAAAGFVYQVSNQVTLGLSEQESIDKMENVVKNIIENERQLRRQLQERDPLSIADRAWRALGTLTCARRLSSEEGMNLLSDLRMGVSVGDLDKITVPELNRLLWEIQPHCILERAGSALGPSQRDAQRAELTRTALKHALV